MLNFLVKHYIALIVGFILVCIVGVTFVTKPELFGFIFKSTKTVTSVDNSVLLNTDLDKLDANIKINSIKQDEAGYHINYSHDTLGIDNGFWKKLNVGKTINVDKSLFKDKKIGKYVAGQIVSNFANEIAGLKTTQASEAAKGYTQMVVTTTYSGIVGQFIDSTEEVVTNPGGTSSNGSNTSTTTPPPTLEELAEIIDQLVEESENNNIIPPTTPLTPPNPSPTTPAPTPSPTPNPNNLIPTPTPLPPQLTPSPSSSGSGSGYFKSDPDVVNTGPVSE